MLSFLLGVLLTAGVAYVVWVIHIENVRRSNQHVVLPRRGMMPTRGRACLGRSCGSFNPRSASYCPRCGCQIKTPGGSAP